MADIFVSYSRTDKVRVAPLVAALEAQGWSVWWDPEITPGDEFDALIGAELESARAVVVVWSPASVDSRWVKGEARDAADRGVLVPVRFENARLPIDVRAIHTTELDSWGGSRDSAAFKALCAALEAKMKLSIGKAAIDMERNKRSAVSICVLPFANMSGDPEQEYFSDGITEDIITDLGKVSALSIVSRATAFSFKGSSADLAQIARQTKAAYVLAGSVRKSGARVRITAQLVGAVNDSQVWGERFDRDLNDIFALQDEISKAIVTALKLTLLPAEKQALEQRGTTNPEAYKLYLMARQFWLLDNERNNEIVVRICRRVVEIDPEYAQGWATLALAQWNMFWQGDSGDYGEHAASTALRIEPNLSDSHSAMAAVYRNKGQFAEGLLECQRAMKLDPSTYIGHRIAGLCCLGLRRYDEAIAYFEFAASAMESDFTASTFISQCYKAKGDLDRMRGSTLRAMDRIEKIVMADPGHSRAIGMGVAMLADLGEKERAREWATRARLVEPDAVNLQYNLACAMSALGENSLALEALEGIAAKLSPGMVSWLEADTDLDPVREEPRFIAMLEEVKARFAKA
ncbi:MAG: TIR domain-containing protein [Pseudomonadota bacterium]